MPAENVALAGNQSPNESNRAHVAADSTFAESKAQNESEHIDEDEAQDEQPFVKVTSKHTRRSKNRNQSKFSRAPSSQIAQSVHPLNRVRDDPIDEERLIRSLVETERSLVASAFYRTNLLQLRARLPAHIDRIVCFGIGPFADCPIARHQLAFVLALRREFRTEHTEFHEPVLSAAERRCLQRLHCPSHPDNLEGKYALPIGGHTLVFLPHCPKQLTNNFLWANWTEQRLRSCSLLCNSFRDLCDSLPERLLRIDAAYVARLQPFVREHALRNTFRHPDIFNDLALHSFEPQAVCADLFAYAVEPDYGPASSELITRQ